jgi:hypothetical protein
MGIPSNFDKPVHYEKLMMHLSVCR